MHPLINSEMVELIRKTGNAVADVPDRVDIMKSLNLPFDQKADNVVIMGCQNLKSVPETIQKFSRILEQGGMSHSFLSREYCCGNYLYRPAIQARDEAAMAECRSFSREFAAMNIEQAKALGARRLILFCSPCYPIYKFAFPDEPIIYFPEAMAEVMGPLSWPGQIDYYAGCYKLHRNLAKVPMDLKSTDAVFNRISGLSVNRISAPACCFKPEGLTHMMGHIKTDCMVHICVGCYFQALRNAPQDKGVRIIMLPDFIDMVQKENHERGIS